MKANTKHLGGALVAAALTVAAVGCVSRPDRAPGDWRVAMWERPVVLREGVTLRAYALEKPRLMKAYVARIDLTTPGLGFTATERDPLWGRPMPDYTNETWLVNTRRETPADFMARRRKAGQDVELAVNTSGWRPWGGRAAGRSTYAALYRWELADGEEISCGKKPGMGTYFIVRKDGGAEIRSLVRPSMTNDMAFALYGNRHLLKNGAPTPETDPETYRELHPRTAFGLTADGKTLVILVVDGRQPGYSLGASRADLAGLLLREGCADAVNMDGGGSSSLVVFDRADNRPVMLNRHAGGYVRKTALNLGITFENERDTDENKP
ncbi:MAG: phosphodiester glycosidase family protein [Kiritimatiellae bacterium]|nr:phosphodiester glycosidase family protein [Kiritimatiellia bacterium]